MFARNSVVYAGSAIGILKIVLSDGKKKTNEDDRNAPPDRRINTKNVYVLPRLVFFALVPRPLDEKPETSDELLFTNEKQKELQSRDTRVK